MKLLITDMDFFIKASKYVEPQFFVGEILPWIYKTAVEYFNKYDTLISKDAFVEYIKQLDKENVLEYVVMVKEIYAADIVERDFLLDKLKEFIKRVMFAASYSRTADLYDKDVDEALAYMEESIGKIQQVGFTPSDRTFFFEDIKDRLIKRSLLMSKKDVQIATGIAPLDTFLGGGPRKGELCVVVADAKKGKSICLMNIGATTVKLHTGKVLHINLEGRNMQTEDRYESRLLAMDYNTLKAQNVDSSLVEREYANLKESLVIRNMIDKWDYTILDIEEEIKDLASRNFIPDVIIVDYGDLLRSRIADNTNTYQSQQEVFRSLKTLATKYNVIVWTAAQTSRAPAGSNPAVDMNFYWTRQNLADCYAKVRVADLLVTLNATDEEMRSNRMRLYLDAYRDTACGKMFNIRTNYAKMKFFDPFTNGTGGFPNATTGLNGLPGR